MLTETIRQNTTARALEAFDPPSIVAGKFDRGELTLEIAADRIAAVCAYLKAERKFVRLSTITAVDCYPSEPRFEVVYHLHSLEPIERLRLKCRLSGIDPEIDSVTGVWHAAGWYEREVFDLFGIRFRNHPDLRRIMLPEDWEGHPLRKDYGVLGSRA